MYNLWPVAKLEFRLIWSSRVSWLIAAVMLIIGALCAANNRQTPWNSWVQIQIAGFYISLILAFCTGNQINRDYEQRLAGIVLTTPVSTAGYVLGKYIAGLASLLLLAGSGLISALVTAYFYDNRSALLIFPPVFYPPLGVAPYVSGWAFFALTPVIFGASFMLAGITLAGGQRVPAYIAAVLIWILPRFLGSTMPQILDLTGANTFPQFSLAAARPVSVSSPLEQFLVRHPSLEAATPPSAEIVQQVMNLTLPELPPRTWPPSLFFWKCLFFLSLSLVLLALTIYGTHLLRRNNR